MTYVAPSLVRNYCEQVTLNSLLTKAISLLSLSRFYLFGFPPFCKKRCFIVELFRFASGSFIRLPPASSTVVVEEDAFRLDAPLPVANATAAPNPPPLRPEEDDGRVALSLDD